MDRTFITKAEKPQISIFQRYSSLGFRVDDMSNESPELLEKQNEMEQANEELEEARGTFDAWNSSFKQKRQEIYDKEAMLAEQKRSLDEFTKHHTTEIEKAMKREQRENELSEKVRIQLEELEKEERSLQAQDNQLRAELSKLQPWAEYLQSVVEICPQFETVERILNRHQALTQTRSEYLEKYQALVKRFGEDEPEIARNLHIAQAHLVDKKMALIKQVAKTSQEQTESDYQRTEFIHDIQRLEEKNADLSRLQVSIRAIYRVAVNQSVLLSDKEPKPDSDLELDEAQMLKFIENRFNDLKDIINDPNVEYQRNSRAQSRHFLIKPVAEMNADSK